MFFGMLSLWRILEAYDRPSTRNQVLAGVAIGLSISSRYLMGILVLPLLVVDLALLRQATGKRKGIVTSAIAGLAALGAAFALSTPYLFLDFWNALRSVRSETRRASLGADGLTPPGNLLWYLTQALPSRADLAAVCAGAGRRRAGCDAPPLSAIAPGRLRRRLRGHHQPFLPPLGSLAHPDPADPDDPGRRCPGQCMPARIHGHPATDDPAGNLRRGDHGLACA